VISFKEICQRFDWEADLLLEKIRSRQIVAYLDHLGRAFVDKDIAIAAMCTPVDDLKEIKRLLKLPQNRPISKRARVSRAKK
jgi:hypothetical protein